MVHIHSAMQDQPTPEFDKEAWQEQCWEKVLEDMPDASDAEKEAYYEKLLERDWHQH